MIRHTALGIACSMISAHAAGQPLAATWIGGSANDQVKAIDVDASGNVYLAGFTTSADLPNAVGSLKGHVDAFVAKLSPDLTTLHWITYIGGYGAIGSDQEWASDVAADGQGGAVITGKTQSADFPTVNALDDTLDGPSDAFVTRVDANGQIVFSTYLGGSFEENADDRGYGQFTGEVEIASDGTIIVAGDTRSEDFPLVDPIDDTFGGFNSDVFVARLSGDGQQLLASTYIGDLYRDEVSEMRLDANDNPVIVGKGGPDWPLTQGAYSYGQFTSSGIVYVTKLAADVRSFEWSSKLDRVGPSGGRIEFIEVAIAPNGTVYASGNATDSVFPVPASAFQPQYTGGSSVTEGIVLGFAPDGSDIVAGTWVGNFNTEDKITALSVTPQGNVIVGGEFGFRVGSDTFPGTVRVYSYDAIMGQREQIFDVPVASIVDTRITSAGNIVAALHTGNLPATPGAFQETNPGEGTPIIGLWSDPNAPCPADTNGDGALTPADFTAWIAGFNAMTPACDQNADGLCTPADFTAWIANFNAGC